ncbi:MAG TPA: hypothetical protein VFZ52_07120 [Chryseolinea sp.]
MGDFQFWLYVLIAAIYVLTRFFKKPAQQQPTDVPDFEPEKPVKRFEPPTVKPGVPPSKTLTFEELLKEITEAKSQPKPAPTPEYVDYDDEIADEIPQKDEIQDLEDVDFDYKKDKVVAEYEQAKRQAFLRPSLEETLNIKDTDTRFEKFKVFEIANQSNLVDRYLTDFYDPEGLKKAIVMSEILQRKF